MRIRSVKPEFWSSESIARLSLFERLLFIGLWNYADDDGRGVDNPALIRSTLFPLDEEEISTADVELALENLELHGRVIRYEAAGRRCLLVTNWDEHQHPSKKRPSTLPEPSFTLPVLLPERSPQEGRGGEGRGGESAARMTDNQKQADVLLAADSRPQYLLGKLIETDARWAKVTPARLMGLSKQFGPAIVISAVEFISETKPALTDSDPYGYLQTVCRSRKEAS